MSGPTHLRSPYIQRIGADAGATKRCKFIEGTKPYGENPWCGKKAIEDSSYCREHHERTHIPVDHRAHRSLTALAEFLARKYR